ncbi:MAG: hypothetical protein RL311_543 [Bacteroidota bacterium]
MAEWSNAADLRPAILGCVSSNLTSRNYFFIFILIITFGLLLILSKLHIANIS